MTGNPQTKAFVFFYSTADDVRSRFHGELGPPEGRIAGPTEEAYPSGSYRVIGNRLIPIQQPSQKRAGDVPLS